jgi:mono/diheme cytochrome c family protein
MKAGFLLLSALLLGAVVALAQVDSAKTRSGAESRFDYEELAKAPDKARAKRNPLAGDESAVAGGKKLFEQHCAECHGATGEGGKKAPSLVVPEVQEATPGAVFWVLTNGVVRRGMPVWSKLPEVQRWQLVTYLRTLKVGELKTGPR